MELHTLSKTHFPCLCITSQIRLVRFYNSIDSRSISVGMIHSLCFSELVSLEDSPAYRIQGENNTKVRLLQSYGLPYTYSKSALDLYETIPYGVPYTVLQAPDLSRLPRLTFLTLMLSRACDDSLRMTVRNNTRVSQHEEGFHIVFVMARSCSVCDDRVREENARYRDILQLDHVDSYHNITLGAACLPLRARHASPRQVRLEDRFGLCGELRSSPSLRSLRVAQEGRCVHGQLQARHGLQHYRPHQEELHPQLARGDREALLLLRHRRRLSCLLLAATTTPRGGQPPALHRTLRGRECREGDETGRRGVSRTDEKVDRKIWLSHQRRVLEVCHHASAAECGGSCSILFVFIVPCLLLRHPLSFAICKGIRVLQ